METNRPQILIIDDDSRNIFALSLVLKSKGYLSKSVSSIDEGIKLLHQHQEIGIILMDMMMPEMDGYDGIKAIKSISQFKNLPIIAVTAQAMQGDKEKCLAAGANDYVSKPIDIDKLLVKIEKVQNDRA